jgi:hypothetical protein
MNKIKVLKTELIKEIFDDFKRRINLLENIEKETIMCTIVYARYD